MPLSEAHRRKLSDALKRYRKTPEHCQRISAAKKGHPVPSERRDRIRATLKAKGVKPPRPPRDRHPRGESHHWWRGGVTSSNEAARKTPEYKAWRTAVFVRDDYTCRGCGRRGGRLHADHVKPFALHPELRYDINNGRTLCEPCHRATPTYGVNVNRDLWGNQAPVDPPVTRIPA